MNLQLELPMTIMLTCSGNGSCIVPDTSFDWIRAIASGPPGRKYTLDAKVYLIDKQYQLPRGTELRGAGTAITHRTETKAVGQTYTACAGTASAPGLVQGRKGLLLGDDTYVSGLHMRGMETRRLDCMYAMIEKPGCINIEGIFPHLQTRRALAD